jgi:hypothetical protein
MDPPGAASWGHRRGPLGAEPAGQLPHPLRPPTGALAPGASPYGLKTSFSGEAAKAWRT